MTKPLRTSFDSLTLRTVTMENARILVGGQVQHVAQPHPLELALTIRTQGANHRLLLSCDARFPRMHTTDTRPSNPSSPPVFCMACRKHLEGRRIVDIRQVGFDRIVRIRFAGAADGSVPEVTLIAELMGRHSNVILVDSHGDILDAMKHITHKVSRHRETLPGRKYLSPPTQGGAADPMLRLSLALGEQSESQFELPADDEAATAKLMDHYQGISPFLAAEIVQRSHLRPLESVWEELFGATGKGAFEPTLFRDEVGLTVGAYPFPSVQHPADQQNSRPSVNVALDHYYSTYIPRYDLEMARHDLQSAINTSLKGTRNSLAKIEQGMREAARAEEFKQTGELLLAHAHLMEEDAKSILVTDYYAEDTPERQIDLDPQKNYTENVELWFKRYRKARNSASHLIEQQARLAGNILELQHASAALVDTENLESIKRFRTELFTKGLLRKNEAVATSGKPEKQVSEFGGYKIRRFATVEGWEILVGESAEANDYLTTKVAAPMDYWLHVRANSSAHVVIRTRKNPTAVPQSVIRQAAMLAARHSAAKHSSMVPVDYVLKKHVRRPRGGAPGMAQYQNEKTIFVNPADD